MTSQSLPALVDALVALTPGTGPAEAPQRAIESLLMDLRNKGEARAREALACLSAIGAKRTGRWLAAALEAGPDADSRGRLDQQFYDRPDNLATLAMAYIGRRK